MDLVRRANDRRRRAVRRQAPWRRRAWHADCFRSESKWNRLKWRETSPIVFSVRQFVANSPQQRNVCGARQLQQAFIFVAPARPAIRQELSGPRKAGIFIADVTMRFAVARFSLHVDRRSLRTSSGKWNATLRVWSKCSG